MSDTEEPDEHRTEGVRIIGAQEAAEAAARPDVVHRRKGREKRYGDRPDEPEATSDLPKITISTTETDGPTDPGRFGAVPVVRPEDDPDADPQWAGDTDSEAADRPGGYGHARLIEPADHDDQVDDIDSDESPPTWEAEPEVRPGVDDATQPWSAEEFAEYAGDRPGHRVDEAYAALQDSRQAPIDPSEDEVAAFDDRTDLADEDDSFVLPHWTEPPTGQVPKVVIGDDPPESDALGSFGSQPRWRDEGERDVVTDFDDLIDEGPRLGALGGGTSVEDDFFGDGYDEVDDDYADDDYADDADDFFDEERSAEGGRRRERGRAREELDDTGGGGGRDRDLVSAIAVGVGLVAVGILCFVLGSITTTLLATALVTLAAWEYFSAVRRAGHNPATLLGMASVIGVMIAAYTSGLAAYPVVLGLAAITGLLWFLWVAPGEGAVPNLGMTMLGVLWIGVLGSFATLFIGLGETLTDLDASLDSNPGIGVLVAAVIAAVSHDVGAYFVGRQFGRTPLSAASPNKTQEGLVGGVVISIVATTVVVGIIGIDPIGSDLAQAFVFALLCALAAPLGDLAESFVKRDLGIKDMGAVLPGHGGVLDRFDAMLFVLPVAYFVTLLFDIWTAA